MILLERRLMHGLLTLASVTSKMKKLPVSGVVIELNTEYLGTCYM